MGRLGLLEGATRPPLANASAEALRDAFVDSAALARLIRRGFQVEVRTGGRLVGKRIRKAKS